MVRVRRHRRVAGTIALLLAGLVPTGGSAQDVKLLLAVGYRVAQADKFPEWKPGNEFKATRDKMLNR